MGNRDIQGKYLWYWLLTEMVTKKSICSFGMTMSRIIERGGGEASNDELSDAIEMIMP